MQRGNIRIDTNFLSENKSSLTSRFPGPIDGHFNGPVICSNLSRVGEDCDGQRKAFSFKRNSKERKSEGGKAA